MSLLFIVFLFLPFLFLNVCPSPFRLSFVVFSSSLVFISNAKQDLQLAKEVCKLGAEQLSCSIKNKREKKKIKCTTMGVS